MIPYNVRKVLANITITTKKPAIMTTISGRSLMKESVDSSKKRNSPADEAGCGAS
jgi:hypothetical protein